MLNESRKKLISGACTLDNCYGLVSDVDIICNSILLPNEDVTTQGKALATSALYFKRTSHN